MAVWKEVVQDFFIGIGLMIVFSAVFLILFSLFGFIFMTNPFVGAALIVAVLAFLRSCDVSTSTGPLRSPQQSFRVVNGPIRGHC